MKSSEQGLTVEKLLKVISEIQSSCGSLATIDPQKQERRNFFSKIDEESWNSISISSYRNRKYFALYPRFGYTSFSFLTVEKATNCVHRSYLKYSSIDANDVIEYTHCKTPRKENKLRICFCYYSDYLLLIRRIVILFEHYIIKFFVGYGSSRFSELFKLV